MMHAYLRCVASPRKRSFHTEINMKFSKLASALAVAAMVTLTAGAANASVVNVGGVIFDPASDFDFNTQGDVTENVVSTANGTIKGYGTFTFFNNTPQSVFCPTCELTYEFSNYTLTQDITGTSFAFTGGLLNIYVDSTPDYLTTSPTSAADGVLFLSLEGSTEYFASLGYTNGETLVGNLAIPNNLAFGGQGSGYLDVTGGLAASYFDTNTQPGGADLAYISGFFQAPNEVVVVGPDGTRYTHRGTITAFGDTQAVPEPGALALMGLGFAGLGFVRRRQKKA